MQQQQDNVIIYGRLKKKIFINLINLMIPFRKHKKELIKNIEAPIPPLNFYLKSVSHNILLNLNNL
jgi:hypothetical protein